MRNSAVSARWICCDRAADRATCCANSSAAASGWRSGAGASRRRAAPVCGVARARIAAIPAAPPRASCTRSFGRATAWPVGADGSASPAAARTRSPGSSHPASAPAHERGGAAYPSPRATRPGDLQESDLVGPRHLRTPAGPVGFFAFHTVDVGGGGAATWQGPDKSAESFCGYLAGCAWPRLGLPLIWQIDNESAVAGFPGRPFTQPVRLALLLGVEVRFIPLGEPGRQADIESFNALWQARVLRRFATPSLARLARVSERFERWYMEERPHPKLSQAAHGTRFPGALLAAQDGALRHMPQGFSLGRFRDAAGQLHLPLARGRISWVRLADEHGTLALQGRRLALGRAAANQYVIATLSTARGDITVRLADRAVKIFSFRIDERVVQRLRPSGG